MAIEKATTRQKVQQENNYYYIRDLLNPVVNKHCDHSESQHSRQTFELHYSARCATNIKKMRYQGFRWVKDVPLQSRFVTKGSSPKRPLTLIPPTLNTNSNHVVVEIDVFVCGLVIVKLDLTTPLYYHTQILTWQNPLLSPEMSRAALTAISG